MCCGCIASIEIHRHFVVMLNSNGFVISEGEGLKQRPSVNCVICETWFSVPVSHAWIILCLIWHELQHRLLLFLGFSVGLFIIYFPFLLIQQRLCCSLALREGVHLHLSLLHRHLLS